MLDKQNEERIKWMSTRNSSGKSFKILALNLIGFFFKCEDKPSNEHWTNLTMSNAIASAHTVHILRESIHSFAHSLIRSKNVRELYKINCKRDKQNEARKHQHQLHTHKIANWVNVIIVYVCDENCSVSQSFNLKCI